MREAGDPATVLVVEDDASLNAALAATLKAAGFRPVTARTAAEGLRWFGHYAPDLVLLDLGLPDRDGLAVIAEIRARGQQEGGHTPIVVLSARNAEAMKVEALDLGADDYVSKPFGVDELLARLRAGLRHAVQARGSAPVVRTGDLDVDLGRRQVARAGPNDEAVAQGVRPARRAGVNLGRAAQPPKTCCARSGAASGPTSSICGSMWASCATSWGTSRARRCW